MRTVCYYISDYGYGHATRSIAVIRHLLRSAGDEQKLIVCAGKTIPFVRDSLGPDWRIRYRRVASDLGYILRSDTLEPDFERFRVAYERELVELPERVELESAFLRAHNVGLVVSDISPVPFAAAQRCGIPSVGVSNFTWYTAYNPWLEWNRLEPLHEAYAQMDYFIRLAGASEPDWGRLGRLDAGFICRPPSLAESAKLRKTLCPDGKRRIVFFALGMSVEAEDLAQMRLWHSDECLFFVSGNMQVDFSNVIPIPSSITETQNVAAASDLVVTKPGWGTVSEAVCLGKPLLLIKRRFFEEDRNTIGRLDEIGHPYRLMEWDRLRQFVLTRPMFSSSRIGTESVRVEALNERLDRICSFLKEIML